LWTDFYDMHLIVDIESVFKVLGYKLRIVIVHHMNLFSWCFFFKNLVLVVLFHTEMFQAVFIFPLGILSCLDLLECL
jgi:hypothetical protein